MSKHNTWDNQAQYLVRKKKRLLKKRYDNANKLKSTPTFENLDLSKMPDLMSIIKANRWQLHAKAAALNLAVTQKRSHSFKPNDLQQFTGQSDTYLAISRAALVVYSTGNPITAAACANIVSALDIHKTSVYRYLREAVDAGLYKETENEGGVTAYEFTQESSEQQFDNLLELIFDPVTFAYVQALHRIYGMVRMQSDKSYRSFETAMETLLTLVDD